MAIQSNFKSRVLLRALGAVLCLALSLPVLGQDDDAAKSGHNPDQVGPDTSHWQCKSCTFANGLSGYIGFGLGNVSTDFSEFGNFGGLEDQGLFGAFDADLLYRDDDARYLQVQGDRLGLDSRTLSVEGGRQGSYGFSLEYDEIPYIQADGARTVFLGAGSDDQTLPGDWVRGDTTQRMPQLSSSLRDVGVGTKRKTLTLGIDVNRPDPWRYRVNVQRIKKEGSLIQGGSFIFRSALLAAPVDYETTNVEASVGYEGKSWELAAEYDLSVFDNGNTALRWENPFTPINGADQGQIALSPDSQSHQVMLSGSWRMPRWLAVSGQIAFGRMEQDEAFLAPTINSSLAEPTLPRFNLDGRVNTRVANLRVTSNLTDRLGAKAEFKYDERDNGTPIDVYQQVVTDVFVTDLVSNRPYSYERRTANAALDYRLVSWLKVSGEAEHEEMDRTFLEAANTNTDTYALRVRSNPLASLNLNLKLSHEERSSDLNPALLGEDVNPGLRRFYLADRRRDVGRLDADYALRDNMVLGIFFEKADDNYGDGDVGLNGASDRNYGLDVSAIVSEDVSAHAFIAKETINSDITGADIFDPGDLTGDPWRAEENDNFRTAGFGVEFNNLPGKWTRGSIDFTYADAKGNILVEKEDPTPAFPKLLTRRYTLQASVAREISENLDLNVRYLMARRDRNDFFYDGLEPDTIANVLTLGNGLSDETVHVFSVIMRYSF